METGGNGITADSSTSSSEWLATWLSDVHHQALTLNVTEAHGEELVNLYDNRVNDAHLKEILNITDVSREEELHGWHLERLAASQYETSDSTTVQSADWKKELSQATAILTKAIDSTTAAKAVREKMVQENRAQRKRLAAEVESTRAAARSNKEDESS